MLNKDTPLQRLWYGKPPKKIKEVFCGETKEQQIRREAMYFPRSSALLRKTSLDFNKVVAANEFVAHIPEWAATLVASKSGLFIGSDMPAENVPLWAIEKFYTARALHPNSIYYFNPITNVIEHYKPSEIVGRGKSNELQLAVPYGKYTLKFEQGRTLVYQGDKIENEFNYAANIKMATFLGGTTLDENGRYESDFHFAVAELERLETLGSQVDAATALTYPRAITTQMDCRECEGSGYVDNDADILAPQSTCKSCNGKGHYSPGIFERIEVPPHRSEMGDTTGPTSLDNIMRYVTPDIASCDFIAGRLETTLNECKEMLNLARWEDGSVSGVAKRVDNEAGQPRLRAIMHSFFGMVQHVIRMGVNAQLSPTANADAVWGVKFQIPQYIDLRTITELQAQLAEIPNLDLTTRLFNHVAILRKSYRDSEIPQVEACFEVTDGNFLLTQAERLELLGSDVIDEADVWLSISATALATIAAMSYKPNLQQTQKQFIIAELEKQLNAKRAELVPPPNPFNPVP